MDPEERKMLEKTYELAKDNNEMLHRVRGVQKRAFVWSVLKIIVIVGIAFGAFYYLEPYLNKVMNILTQISGMKQNVDPTTLQNALKNIR